MGALQLKAFQLLPDPLTEQRIRTDKEWVNVGIECGLLMEEASAPVPEKTPQPKKRKVRSTHLDIEHIGLELINVKLLDLSRTFFCRSGRTKKRRSRIIS